MKSRGRMFIIPPEPKRWILPNYGFNEVGNTQSSNKKIDPLDGIPMDFFASNGQQEVNYSHLNEIYVEKKTTTVIKLYSCDINPASLLNIHYKIKVLKKHQTLFFDTGERCSFVRANNHQRTDCLRSPLPSRQLRTYIRLKY